MKKSLLLILLFICSCAAAYSQEFLSDGSMKLTAIATDSTYGFQSVAKTSIKVGSIRNEYTYISALLGPNGEKTSARRLGSCCPFESKKAAFGSGLLDKWAISYDGKEQPIIIYINAYEFDDPKCPLGLTFKKE